MATPFLSEIVMVSFNFPPKGYALCNGQLLAISTNTALFSLLGTNFGGNGTTNFALPDLQGRCALHQGQGPGINHVIGESGGAATISLNSTNLPDHTHAVTATLSQAAGSTPTLVSPANAFPTDAVAGNPRYSSQADEQMAVTPLSQMVDDPVGNPLKTENNAPSQQPVPNLAPFTTVNFVIALQGVFPSRS